MVQRVNRERFEHFTHLKTASERRRLTYLPVPSSTAEAPSVQLGLFDVALAQDISRAAAYISALDKTVVDKKSAHVLNIIRTKDNPGHEAIIMLAAKTLAAKQFAYKYTPT